MGEEAYAKMAKQLEDAGFTEEEIREGMFVNGIEASRICDEFLNHKLAHFIRCLVVHYITKKFNSELYTALTKIKKDGQPFIVLMQIPKIAAHMRFSVKD